jgi:transposase InsO family protein
LPLLKDILEVQQEYPRAGRFRVRGLLQQKYGHAVASGATIGRAMRLNRMFHRAPAAWMTKIVASDGIPKHLPYRPRYRHQMWFLDLRYLVRLDGRWVYSICVIEGYSRQILAGMASPYQDLTAVLQLLYAALREFGCPEQLISDNAGVFRADEFERLLAALEIQAHRIERKKPWQNLIEAQFKIQLRLADAKFEQATSLTELETLHAEFVQTFNTTPHWAHRERSDERRTPAEVLEWVRGREIPATELRKMVGGVQFNRYVNRHGFVSIQRFYVYAERGLSRQRVSIWIYEGRLHLEYQTARLADYRCDFNRETKSLEAVSQPRLYRTLHASPQVELFELDDDQWHKIARRTYMRRLQRKLLPVVQLPLAGIGLLSLFWTHYWIEELISVLITPRSA